MLLCTGMRLKLTGPRRILVRVLAEANDHLSVEELYQRALAFDPRISIATVYRIVRLFEEKGILNKRDFGIDRSTRYEANDHGPHHHLIDIEIGNVI